MRLARTAGCFKSLHYFFIGGSANKTITQLTRYLSGSRPTGGNHNGRQLLRQGIEAGILYGVMEAPVALDPALPQQANDFNRLLQHLQPNIVGRPAVAQDMLVQVLA